MLVDLSAIRDAAAKRESNHWLMANAANPANLANQKPESPDELAKLATLAGLAISHGLEAPPPNPGMAQLLALADRYCTAIQASDKARTDWRADIEATPPNDRQGLAAHLRGELSKLVPSVAPKPAPPAVVSPAATPSPAKPLPKFSVHQPWNVADRAYQAHHWSCTTCKATARSGGSSQRCATGQHLYATYEQAFEAGKEST
ncbi:hypothetical protein [Giesbergeria anulus]|uniref:Uncharacterized protein n=1 Tax=Giesbergeria anulus TaxID=180197 RepID=A0A1H9G3W9_9BURK|nr:hypothetical protein [Giesbergeria anulus]SEQ44876.1 hypothetical protein SAMN02982919_00712 [Giesbergeria anulus]